MSARTLTPRRTAASSSRSSSGRSKRKMQISTSLLARRTAWTTGTIPASGCTINFTALVVTLHSASGALRQLCLRLLVPRDFGLGLRREAGEHARDAIRPDLARRRDEILHRVRRRRAQLEFGTDAPPQG